MFNLNVSIIIPNWNGRYLLEKNLGAVVAASKNKKNKISEIIVVDDASTDDSVPFLKKEYKETIKILGHKENRGFSSTVNTGIRSAKNNLICLLNTDVVPNKNFLEKAILHFKKEKVFGVSLHEEGYGPSKGRFLDGYIIHEPGTESDKTQETFWVSGGSGIFRRDLWLQVGWLDEKLFPPFYWEDVDLCYRALKRGYILLWEPKGLIYHKHESTINQNNFNPKKLELIKERNQLFLIWKNLTSSFLFRKHIVGLIRRIIKHPGYLRVLFLALPKIGDVLKLRSREQKESIVSDEAIFAKF